MTEVLQNIYHRLMERYGPQHWWPAKEPFEVIIGAILGQATAWTNAEKAIANLRKADKLSPEKLRRLTDSTLAGLIRSCGYYNVKARKLKAFVNWLGERYDDSLERLFAQDMQHLRRELLGVYGIGEETADCIILYAGNKPIAVIDAYTRRFIDRAGLTPDGKGYAAYQAFLMENLRGDAKLYNELHALFTCLAKDTCRKRPLCEDCCLNTGGTSQTGRFTTPFPCSDSAR